MKLLKNVRIPAGGNEAVEASILIDEGRVVALTKEPGHLGNFDEVIDCNGLIALPGGIDIHAHVYDPLYPDHEDFRSGSEAALHGGVTTFFDMPLRAYVESEESFRVKYEAGLRDSVVNFGIIGGMMNENNLTSVRTLQSLGVNMFKVFTCRPFRPENDSGLSKVVETVVRNGGVLVVHAEDDALTEHLAESFKSSGRHDARSYHESRPATAEALAINRVARIARFLKIEHGVHVAHLSSRIGLGEVVQARLSGVELTVEVTPHHLYFTREDVERLGNYLKLAPTLKDASDVRALWKGLASGVIDAVASDNAPSTRFEKEVDVWSAWGGIPSLEVMLPLVFTLGVKKTGVLTLERFVEVTSTNPARITGIHPRKGVLALNSDADLILIDPNLCFEVTPARLHHKVGWTPFEGLELCGWPRHAYVNGQLVMRDRELVTDARGSYVPLRPKAFSYLP
ncbi:MAG: dihydroorotase family protein [Zestosphaera sp.]